MPTVPPPPASMLEEYRQLIVRRFANPKIGDTISRLCLDGSNRQPKFILPPARDRLAAKGEARRGSRAGLGAVVPLRLWRERERQDDCAQRRELGPPAGARAAAPRTRPERRRLSGDDRHLWRLEASNPAYVAAVLEGALSSLCAPRSRLSIVWASPKDERRATRRRLSSGASVCNRRFRAAMRRERRCERSEAIAAAPLARRPLSGLTNNRGADVDRRTSLAMTAASRTARRFIATSQRNPSGATG